MKLPEIRVGTWSTTVVIVAASAVIAHLAIEAEAFELLYHFSREHEEWELDEVIIGAVVGLFALIAFLLLVALRERNAAYSKVHALAHHDPLTGLLNRRGLFDQITRLPAVAGRPVLLLIDLDRFKSANDLHGHLFGDTLLRLVSEWISAAAGPDDLVARLGGDEFVLVVSGGKDSPGRAEHLARQLIRAISADTEVDGVSVMIGASIGLAIHEAGKSAQESLRRADQALYSAKEAGRGRLVWFDADLDREARRRESLMIDLKAAIDAGEINPHFQPIFEIASGRIIGFEALARWTHPERGPIGPDEFIPLAEDGGMIGALGAAVLRKAVETVLPWGDLRVSVNLSPHQMSDATIPDRVAAILEETGFPPGRLALEVTESAVISDLAKAREVVGRLRAMGVGVHLDDFGTGYSSLTMLHDLVFDRIKIDRSFVSGMQGDKATASLVAGILALAREMDLDVVAEGIEDPSELTALTSLGCGHGQGYLVSKPLTGEQVAFHLETNWSNALAPDEEPEALQVVRAGGASGQG